MICGFLNGKIVSAEEYLIDYSIRTSQSLCIPTKLLNMPIIFDGNDVKAVILDILTNGSLILQLALPIKDKFDDKSNIYKTSYIRNLINSKDFLSRFNKEFIEHIKPTEVYTEDYITTDKLWLLSHEEINLANTEFLKRNKTCKSFDVFKHIDLKSYSETLLNNQQDCYSWRLRSANSNTNYEYYSRYVGYVSDNGLVYRYYASIACNGALLPVCTIG